MPAARNQAELRVRSVRHRRRCSGHDARSDRTPVLLRERGPHKRPAPAMNGQSFQGGVLRVEEARPPPRSQDRARGLPPPPPGRRAGFRVKVFGIGPNIRWQHLKVGRDPLAAGCGGGLTDAAPCARMIAGRWPPRGRGHGASQRGSAPIPALLTRLTPRLTALRASPVSLRTCCPTDPTARRSAKSGSTRSPPPKTRSVCSMAPFYWGSV